MALTANSRLKEPTLRFPTTDPRFNSTTSIDDCPIAKAKLASISEMPMSAGKVKPSTCRLTIKAFYFRSLYKSIILIVPSFSCTQRWLLDSHQNKFCTGLENILEVNGSFDCHTVTDLSSEPLNSIELIATKQFIVPVWPVNACLEALGTILFDWIFQTLIARSSEEE